MNDNVRFAALRAASKLALGVTFVGCAATEADLDDSTYGASTVSDTEPGADEYDVKGASKSKAKKKPKIGGTTPTACQDAGAPQSCEALLTATFADPAWNDFRDYRWEESNKVPVAAARVKDCCRADLDSPDSLGKFRWECCNLLGNGNSTGPGTPMACTPWGPPVPPFMTRKARAARHVRGVA